MISLNLIKFYQVSNDLNPDLIFITFLPLIYEITNKSSYLACVNAKLFSDLITKKTSMVKVVESLAAVLTSEDKVIRKQGVEFLSWLLSKLPSNFLTTKELDYFSAFFCDRLADHHSIVPATLQGILHLVGS